MPEQIPDLWRLGEGRPHILYQLYLAQLMQSQMHEKVVTVCDQIGHYAAGGPGREAALFTASFEIDAQCELGHYTAAWSRLRENEAIALGRQIDLNSRGWPADELAWFEFYHVPLLYFLGRFREGCALLDAVLDLWFVGKKVRSYDLLNRIDNGDPEPTNRCRVTLTHFYGRLGKDLIEWPHWESFVNGFHPKLFRFAEIRRVALLSDSGHLPAFFDRVMAMHDERTELTNISDRERDLTDSEEVVRVRQEAIRDRRERSVKESATSGESLTGKLHHLFPDLRNLKS